MNLTEIILAGGAAPGAERTALVCEGRRWSFADLIAQSERAAAALAARKVGRGDRVAVMTYNCPEFLATFFGCARLGAILATVNPVFREHEVRFILAHSEPSCLVVDRPSALVVEPILSGAGRAPCPILELEDASRGLVLGASYQRALESAPPAPAEEDLDPQTPVLISYTSGSTGQPKAVFTTHAAEAWSAAAHRGIWRINALDSVVMPLPLSWAYGLSTVTLTCLSVGARVVMLPRFRPDTLLHALAEERATLFFGVTTMYAMLRNYARDTGSFPELPSLRLALSGGERRNDAVFSWFREVSGVPVSDAYAMSEVRPVMTYDPLVDPETRPGSCGMLVPGVEARLLDSDGRPAADGEPGELWVRSPGMFSGYFRQPEMTARALTPDGWLRTGDIMRRDGDGYGYFLGRANDMITRGGANISPVEVQDVLAAHPAVREAIVAGLDDPVYGQAVGALVVGEFASDDEAKAALRAFADGKLAEFKIPTVVRVVAEVPRTPTGKFDRRRVVELLAKTG